MWTATILPLLGLVSLTQHSHGVLTDEMVKACNSFSIDLMKTMRTSENGNQNLVMSPLSLNIVLGMVQQGAVGTTLDEMDQVLHARSALTKEGFRNLTKEYSEPINEIVLEIANKLFVKPDFAILPKFKKTTVQDFRSDIEALDFSKKQSAVNTVNSWASEKTHQRIQSIITPDIITEDTVMMVLNAVYFSGEWDTLFLKSSTNMQRFTKQDRTYKEVETMHHYRKILAGGYSSDIGAKYVHLPFTNNEFSILLLVPNAVHELDTVLNALTSEKLSRLIRQFETRNVNVTLPKFKFDVTAKLVDPLKSMGVNALFGESANLSGIVNKKIMVTDVLQKAEVEVDEKGAKAAAVTGLHAVSYSMPRPSIDEEVEIAADHPFLFFIVHRRNNIPVFCGWVMEP